MTDKDMTKIELENKIKQLEAELNIVWGWIRDKDVEAVVEELEKYEKNDR